MISQSNAENIKTTIADIRKNKPAFANIAEAFKELLIQRSCIKTEMALPEPSFKPDPVRFSQGVSAWLQDSPVPAENYLQNAVDRLFPVIRKGFYSITFDLSIFKTAITEQRLAPMMVIEAMLKGQVDSITETAYRTGITPGLLQFVTIQLMKPFLEKLSEGTSPLIAHLE